MIPDQKKLWDKKHAAGEHESFRGSPSSLAKIVEPKLVRNSKLLDLGCGTGRDAVFFARKGHDVIATDISDVVIKQDQQHFSGENVEFVVLDMQKPLPYADSSFDVVFANLSLHYYDHKTTTKIFCEIFRVLKPDGILTFSCKSVNDFHYGNGEEIEKDVFVSEKGHVRHLFSITYTKELLAKQFEVEWLKEVVEKYSGEKSAMIQCMARKK